MAIEFFNSDVPFMHRLFANAYGDLVASLTEDQFALWWRTFSDEERQTEYDQANIIIDSRENASDF